MPTNMKTNNEKSMVTSVNPEVRNAVAILVSYNEGREEYDDEVSQQRLRDSLALLSEWLLCVNQNGDVTQRGHIPSVWNKDTIFDNYPKDQKRFDFQKVKQTEFKFEELKDSD